MSGVVEEKAPKFSFVLIAMRKWFETCVTKQTENDMPDIPEDVMPCRYCGGVGETKRRGPNGEMLGGYCRHCNGNKVVKKPPEEFDPGDDLGTPASADIPRDHPSNKPKPGYRPADK